MYSNAPDDYVCPFCLLAAGTESPHVTSRASDLVFQDEEVMAFVCARQWPNNPGHVLVVPVDHYENIFDLPVAIAARIHELAREIALAMKTAYGCAGISTRQHNEPAGNQEVWHYHLHVYPRYPDDALYSTEQGTLMEPEERAQYASLLRAHLPASLSLAPVWTGNRLAETSVEQGAGPQ